MRIMPETDAAHRQGSPLIHLPRFPDPLHATASGACAAMPWHGAGDGGRPASCMAPAGRGDVRHRNHPGNPGSTGSSYFRRLSIQLLADGAAVTKVRRWVAPGTSIAETGLADCSARLPIRIAW